MSIRTERVARLIQREIADLLNTEFADQLQQMMTVTGARVTRDLSIAYVYVSILGETDAMKQAAFRHLQGMTPQIRAALASRIRHQVRQIPELRFFLDDTLEQAQRIEDLFARIRAERERRSPESDE
ncbi:MAG: 30S ribosome-binding factor RbfA [Bacteroidetes bacterium]|nr:MAG: 30S ribosome-binding factor RbfA [Bacteroidota bacterium]